MKNERRNEKLKKLCQNTDDEEKELQVVENDYSYQKQSTFILLKQRWFKQVLKWLFREKYKKGEKGVVIFSLSQIYKKQIPYHTTRRHILSLIELKIVEKITDRVIKRVGGFGRFEEKYRTLDHKIWNDEDIIDELNKQDEILKWG